MSVLVVNAGSSSVKYALLDPERDGAAGLLAKGLVERIGTGDARSRHDGPSGRAEATVDAPDHAAAFATITRAFAEHGPPLAEGLVAVGHRVVHGGERFTAPTVVDDAVLAEVERLSVLAPLHNPVNVAGIRAARSAFPDVPHVAVFDTAFHATLPPAARTYAVPRVWEQEYGVRKYGFHGTSHAYVSRAAGRWLAAERGVDPATARVVVLHLGNGASACGTLGGRSVEVSMGLTPLGGLVMGTRSGDVDPAVYGHLERVAGLDASKVELALNKESGMVGLCGDSDMREIGTRAEAGDPDAEFALTVYAHRVRGYLGAYAMALGGLDAVVFTAGVGENDGGVRAAVLDGLGWLGLEVDPSRNAGPDGSGRLKELGEVSAAGSRVAALVIPTDEEREIASQALAVATA